MCMSDVFGHVYISLQVHVHVCVDACGLAFWGWFWISSTVALDSFACTYMYIPGVQRTNLQFVLFSHYMDYVVEIKSLDLATSLFACLFPTEPPQCLSILVFEEESLWKWSVFIWLG